MSRATDDCSLPAALTDCGEFVDVALAVPGSRPFTYSVPLRLRGMLLPGVRVKVPFGPHQKIGYAVGFPQRCERTTRPVLEAVDDRPVIDAGLLDLTRWAADYYLCGWGEAIRAALPPGMDERQLRLVRLLAGDALAAAGNDPLLALLRSRDTVAYAYLVRHGGRGAEERLHELRRSGIVAFESVWARATVGIKRQRWLRLVNDGDVGPRAAAQRELLERLRERGPLSASELQACRPAAAALVRKGFARWEEREDPRIPPAPAVAGEQAVVSLTPEQQAIVDRIAADIDGRSFGVNLLHGVTASGKTEVYLQLARRAVERGLQCLILVPEIGLTSQMVARVRSRLPSPAIIHSELGAGERYDIWRGIRDGRYPVVVGTRSAVFAPLQRLGLVVIDEEHDRSFKQSEGHPLYHGRDVAIYRARSCGAPVVLGSATPSAESYHHAREGKYRLFTLDQRVGGAAVPAIEMVDSRSAESAILTPSLELALRDCLASGGQAMLLLNRRGFSPSIQCRACGQVLRCVNCSVGLSYHRTSNRLLCHYCGYARALDASCPQCRAPDLSARGVGIQRLHHELQALLPQTRVLRMDSDATASKGAHDRILSQFQEGRAQVLLGTQMIAKGHHFPAVTLAGIVSLDELLGLPDFRSEERVFQLATQMAGRAGRGRNPGRVLVQTMQPDAPLMRQIRDHDYRGFISQQLATRREAGYPPYSNLALVTVAAATPEDAQRRASAIAASLQDGRRGLTVLGPAPAAIACLRGRHRWQVLVKASERPVLHRCLEPVAAQRRPEPGVTVTVDIDPAATL